MGQKGKGGDKNTSSKRGDGTEWDISVFVPQLPEPGVISAWAIPRTDLAANKPLIFDVDLQGQSEVYLPMYLYNDGVADLFPTQLGNSPTPHAIKWIVLNFDEDGSGIGFSQDTYVLKESWDAVPSNPTQAAAERSIIGSLSQFTTIPDDINSDQDLKYYKQVATLINGSNYPTEAPKLIANSTITDTIIFIEDAQTPITQLGDAANSLSGTVGADYIHAGGGDDEIFAGDGDNFVRGEAGNDRLFGGINDDALFGDGGDDTLTGGPNDLTTSTSSEYLNGGSGNDVVYGERGWDAIDGMGGNDILYGDYQNSSLDQTNGEHLDIIHGGSGNDIIYGGGDQDYLFGESGNDIIYAGIGDDNGTNAAASEIRIGVSGGVGDDQIYGEAGNDVLYGDEGDDLLDGGIGDDTLEGGTGFDTASYSFYLGSINANLKTGIVTFSLDPTLTETLVAIEGILGAAGNDTLTGSDTNDLLDGGTGNDTLSGGLGDDIYVVDSAGDVINETAGTGIETVRSTLSWTLQPGLDHLTLLGNNAINGIGNNLKNILTGNSASNYLFGGEDDDILDGGAGADILEGGTGNDLYRVDSLSDTILDTPQTGLETVEASVNWTLLSGLDNLRLVGGAINGTGNALPNLITGNSANNALRGNQGDDTLTGGTGADRFEFSDAAQDGLDSITDFVAAEDRIGIYIGVNNPTSVYRSAGLTLNSVIRTDQLQLGTAATRTTDRFIYNRNTGALFFDRDGSGTQAQIQIATLPAGLALTNTNLFAFDGSNGPIAPINRPSSPPSQTGTAGNDQIIGSNQNDTLIGLAGNDTLSGEQGNDLLMAGAGNDVVRGGAGNDRLKSGSGNDRLFGGLGRDIFDLDRGLGIDRIQDFKDRQDRLGLPQGVRFKQLKTTSRGRNTLISLNNDSLAILVNVRANLITAADFTRT